MKNIYKFSLTALLLVTVLYSKAQQPLSLQDAVDLAIQNNENLKASQLEIEKAQQQRNIARALFLPTVTAGAQANHFFQRNPFFGFGSEVTSDKIQYGRFGGEDQLAVTVSALQPLYNPIAGPSVRQARLIEQESELTHRKLLNETVTEVKQTYLQLLLVQERIRLQEESLVRNRLVLRDSRSLFLQGKAIRVDTLRAYTAVKNLEPALLKLKNELATNKIRLQTLLGVDSTRAIALTDSLYVPTSSNLPSEEEVYSVAKGNNPEYLLFDLQEKKSAQQVSVASSSRLPVLSAVGQYQVLSQTNNFNYERAYYPSASFVGLQLGIPLFNGFATQSRVKQSRIQEQQSRLKSHYKHEDLRRESHKVLADAHESYERMATTAVVRETAQLSYDIIQYRYAKGIASRLELADAEFELSKAQSNHLEAVYDYLISSIALAKLMGTSY